MSILPAIPPLQGVLVCPHCKRADLVEYAFVNRDGSITTTHHCRQHGDIVPLRSAVYNVYTEAVDWSAA